MPLAYISATVSHQLMPNFFSWLTALSTGEIWWHNGCTTVGALGPGTQAGTGSAFDRACMTRTKNPHFYFWVRHGKMRNRGIILITFLAVVCCCLATQSNYVQGNKARLPHTWYNQVWLQLSLNFVCFFSKNKNHWFAGRASQSPLIGEKKLC